MIHKRGWSCSRKCEVKAHDKIARDINGKPTSTIRTRIVYINGLYHVEGKITEGNNIEAIIKHDDTAELVMYKGHAIGQDRIKITSTLNVNKSEILDKIDNLKNRRK